MLIKRKRGYEMKKVQLFITTAILSTVMGMTALAGEWKQDTIGWWYQNDGGGYPVNCWQNINGKEYYFNESGYLLTSTTTPDGKQVDSNGALVRPIFDVELSGSHLTYLKHEVTIDYDDKPCFVLYYDYMNKASEPWSAFSNARLTAFQNGIECSSTVLLDDNTETENYNKDVMTGRTLSVAEVFELYDKSPVTLIIKDGFIWQEKSQPTTVTINLE